ncbi:hypothetical protein Cgig2_015739 [Carnegiea gigantea]|uniref:Uncharacterized protein n=1 Tax=Carnegiea gigantea TaxID=171969 RepID=A0A9Q1JMF4_9CARY|nr:hypothetical protein Cgig2_015739 [Carnegiea gigantea]
MVTSKGCLGIHLPRGSGIKHRESDIRSCAGVLCLVLEESFASASSASRRFPPLCLCFSLPEAESAAADFELPEMVQAIFYDMLLSEAIKLGVLRDFIAKGMKSALGDLRWSSFKVWMSCVDHELTEPQLRRQAVAVEVCGPPYGREESCGSNDPPALSIDEE